MGAAKARAPDAQRSSGEPEVVARAARGMRRQLHAFELRDKSLSAHEERGGSYGPNARPASAMHHHFGCRCPDEFEVGPMFRKWKALRQPDRCLS